MRFKCLPKEKNHKPNSRQHHISNAKKKKINWDLMVKLLQTMHTSNHVWGELDDPSHRKLNLSSAEKEFLSRIPRPLSLEG